MRVDVFGKEFVAACVVAPVVMAGNDEDVAANAAAPRALEPIGAAALDQLHELEFVLGQVATERFLLVGRVDGDGADGLLRRGVRGKRHEREERHDECREGEAARGTG